MPILALGLMASQINPYYREQIRSCIETWIGDAEKLKVEVRIYCGQYQHSSMKDYRSDLIVNLPGVGDDVFSATDKQYQGYKHLYKTIDADFYGIAGTDNYIVIDRLLNDLRKYDKNKSLYIGGHPNYIEELKLSYFSGGDGLFLTKSSLKILLPYFDNIRQKWPSIVGHDNYLILACDVSLGFFCREEGIEKVQMMNVFACAAYDYSCQHHNLAGFFDWDTVIMLHYIKTREMINYVREQVNQSISACSKKIIQIDQAELINIDYTVVTALYDLSKMSDAPTPLLNIEERYKGAETLLSLKMNMVIFTEKSEEKRILQIRAKHNLLGNTKIITCELTKLPSFKYYEKVKEDRARRKYSPDPRNTSSFFLLSCAKFDFLNQTAKDNPFNSHILCWIDFDLNQTNPIRRHILKDIFRLRREKFSTGLINYWPKTFIKDYPVFYLQGHCTNATGFMTGSVKYIQEVSKKFFEYLDRVVGNGFGHADEQILYEVWQDNLDLFDPFNADYDSLLVNYEYPRRSHQILFAFLQDVRADSDHQISYPLLNRLVEGYMNGSVKLEPDLVIKMMDEYYIATWYRGNQEQCLSIISQLAKLCQSNEKIEEAFIRQGEHLFNNTNFSYPFLKSKYKYIKEMDSSKGLEFLLNLQSNREDFDPKVLYIIYTDLLAKPISSRGLITQNPIVRPSHLRL